MDLDLFLAGLPQCDSLEQFLAATVVDEDTPFLAWNVLLNDTDIDQGDAASLVVTEVQGSTGNVIVGCMKNEAPYIVEWVAYHRAMGVDNFLIYTNDCTDGTDELLDVLAEKGITVEIVDVDAANKPAAELRLFAGHAGWSAGQLQRELDRDDWFIVPGDRSAVFDTTGSRLWERLIERLDPAGIFVREAMRAAR